MLEIKKAEINWWLVGLIIAIIFLIVFIAIIAGIGGKITLGGQQIQSILRGT